MTIRRVLFWMMLMCGYVDAQAQYATLAGTLQSSNGLPASNYILSFQPSQFGYIGGTGVVINAATYCATSTDGSVVGVPNPLQAPPTTVGFTGTLPPANYFVKVAFYDASANLTLVSPETVIQLNSTGRLIVASPLSGLPAGASGMKVYVSTSTNSETLQGQSTGSAAFILSIPLVTGASPASSNTTLCKQVANDAIWPTGTGYTVALTDPAGNTLPGYPMMWQLMGPNTTINLSSGLPYYHGTVYFPTPILASPLNHAQQSISGPVSLAGYNLTNVGAIGFGTSLPAWPIDVENGAINASGGYIFNGGAGVATGNCLLAGSDAFHIFDTPAQCLTPSTAFYQTIQTNTTPVAQRAALNFSSRFALTDLASPSRSTVDLATVVSAATCAFPASITYDVYGRVTACTGSASPVVFVRGSDVVGSRAFGSAVHNTTGFPLLVSGNGQASSGSSTAALTCVTGPTSTPTSNVYSNSWGATIIGGAEGFSCPVDAGDWYEIIVSGDIGLGGASHWFETQVQ